MGKDPLVKKGRAALGLVIAVIGIVVTRVAPPLCADNTQQMVIYMLGVLLGLAGLCLFGFALKVTQVKMSQCPNCFVYFEPKFTICPHCSKPLPVVDSGARSQEEIHATDNSE